MVTLLRQLVENPFHVFPLATGKPRSTPGRHAARAYPWHRWLGALAPLPAANLGTLFATILELGTKDDDSDAPFRICPAGG